MSSCGNSRGKQQLLPSEFFGKHLNPFILCRELRTNSARLARAEKQLTGLAIHSQELAKAKQENQQLAEKVAEAEVEMETLKGAF